MLSGGFRRTAESGDVAVDLLCPASTASLRFLKIWGFWVYIGVMLG